jgi:hypothetical protein
VRFCVAATLGVVAACTTPADEADVEVGAAAQAVGGRLQLVGEIETGLLHPVPSEMSAAGGAWWVHLQDFEADDSDRSLLVRSSDGGLTWESVCDAFSPESCRRSLIDNGGRVVAIEPSGLVAEVDTALHTIRELYDFDVRDRLEVGIEPGSGGLFALTSSGAGPLEALHRSADAESWESMALDWPDDASPMRFGTPIAFVPAGVLAIAEEADRDSTNLVSIRFGFDGSVLSRTIGPTCGAMGAEDASVSVIAGSESMMAFCADGRSGLGGATAWWSLDLGETWRDIELPESGFTRFFVDGLILPDGRAALLITECDGVRQCFVESKFALEAERRRRSRRGCGPTIWSSMVAIFSCSPAASSSDSASR